MPFELSRQEVAELLLAFKPGKGDLDASVRIEQKSPDGDLTVTDVSGLWPGKSIAYPVWRRRRLPDLALSSFAGLVEEPVAATVDEFIVAGQRLAAFKAASSAYSKPLVLEPRRPNPSSSPPAIAFWDSWHPSPNPTRTTPNGMVGAQLAPTPHPGPSKCTGSAAHHWRVAARGP